MRSAALVKSSEGRLEGGSCSTVMYLATILPYIRPCRGFFKIV